MPIKNKDCAYSRAQRNQGTEAEGSDAEYADEPNILRSVDYLLIKRFKGGDLRAFEILVTKYQRRVASLINKQVRNAGVSEELTQEVFLRVFRSLHHFRFESAFATWLYAIARNMATSYYRDGHVKADTSIPISGLTDMSEAMTASQPFETSPSPEETMACNQLLAAIEQSIAHLPVQMRTSIVLREMEEWCYADIATALELPLNTVRSLIFRARATIALEIRPLLDRAMSVR